MTREEARQVLRALRSLPAEPVTADPSRAALPPLLQRAVEVAARRGAPSSAPAGLGLSLAPERRGRSRRSRTAMPASQQVRLGDAPAVPSWIKRRLERQCAVENTKADPRPSHVVARLRKAARSEPGVLAWLGLHRGTALQFARASLRDQPKTPLTYPPETRDLQRPLQYGRPGIAEAGATQLSGHPIAAEAFSGGGLYELALWAEGVFVRESCELNKWAVRTLQANLNPSIRASNALQWEPTVPMGGLDLLTGGPPCTDFTPARALGRNVPLVRESPRNMFPRVLDWICDTQPRVVLLENSGAVAVSNPNIYRKSQIVAAPGVEPRTKGGRSEDIFNFFDTWWKNLSALGYQGHYWLMYAPDYGTPQNRLRAWVVAYPKGAPWGPALTTLPPVTHGYPESRAVREGYRLPWVSALDRLVSGCCGNYGLTGCVHLNNQAGACWTCIHGSNYSPAPNSQGKQGRQALSYSMVKHLAGWWDGAGKVRLKQTGFIDLTPWAAFRRRAPVEDIRTGTRVRDWLAKAMLARGEATLLAAPPDMPRHLYDLQHSHDEDERRTFVKGLLRLSLREMAKLQDVPQWWEFKGPVTQVARQIGNGIAVNMGRAAVRQVMRALGYEAPLAHSLGADPLSGLWPERMLDGCAPFNAPFGPPDKTVLEQLQAMVDEGLIEGPTRKVGFAQSRRRPVEDPDELEAFLALEQGYRKRRREI